MRDKLIRFIDNTNGHFQEVSYQKAEYQCMDLVYEWIFCLDFPKSAIQHQYAYEVYTQATDFTRQYFDIIQNLKETIPQEGDIVVWNKTNSNIAGHIAIVIEATQISMKVFEQNNPVGSNAHIQDRSYTNCLGFLRPKISSIQEIPVWLKTLFAEQGMDFQKSESIFRDLWTKGLKYDDDVRSLQEQVKSANNALADRASEVSALTEKNQKLSDKVAETEEIINLVRSKNDTISYEKSQLEIQINSLSSEVKNLQEKVDGLQSDKPLLGYSWKERFFSLFRR